MLKHTSAITLALLATAGAASANGLTYSTVEGSYYDIEDTDAQTLSGAFDYVTGKFSFTGDAGYLTVEDLDLSTIGLTVGYAIIPGLTVYGSLDYLDLDVDGASGDDTALGLGVEYQTADYGIALDYTSWDDLDVDTTTLAGYYMFDGSAIYARYSNIEAGAGDEDAYLLGYTYEASNWDVDLASAWGEDFDDGSTFIASTYDFNDAFTFGVSLMTYNEDFGDYGIATIGGTYNFTETVSLEANYGQSFGFDADYDGFALALKWENGSRRLRVMDQVEDYASDVSPLYDLLNQVDLFGAL
ncbi:hypothetical protein [uncultured Celeribacter sp.]|uniref:hypothetical protein n=1 Tax=uncultured Celeribacter sp. TaxID=1303376 RepID=UPI002AA6B027|nr:hypothetical protein [uncultured Celeribacter sp.]